jgi:hypothetical protein
VREQPLRESIAFSRSHAWQDAMTCKQNPSSGCPGLTSASHPAPSTLGASPRAEADFTESGKILCLDRLTLALTAGNITASQTTRKKRIFYA